MKLYEITGSRFPTTREEVAAQLEKYNIKRYKINADLSIDVKGSVDLSGNDFTTLPIKFGLITGNFDCRSCEYLASLEGAPTIVTGYFNCKGAVALVSLENVSVHLEGVKGEFYCSWSNIKNGGLGLVSTQISELIDYQITPPFKIIQKYLGTDNIIECQSELIEAGFEDYAVL